MGYLQQFWDKKDGQFEAHCCSCIQLMPLHSLIGPTTSIDWDSEWMFKYDLCALETVRSERKRSSEN